MPVDFDTPDRNVLDTIVIGGGFAGMYAVHALHQNGFTVKAFETGTSVGGTWYWNRYPGARCDVESLSYSYSFDEELVNAWDWTERFATQPEILDYAEWVADRLDLNRHFTFDTRVERAELDERTSTWLVRTGDGAATRAKFLITAVGCLSAQAVPPFEAIEDFTGTVLHTGAWPKDPVDFTGQRVAVIGTGSSGIQVIPEIAQQAAHLTVLQRTPSYSLPARNRPLYADERLEAKKNQRQIRERALTSRVGMVVGFGHQGVEEVTEEQRHDILERYWHSGGNELLVAFNDSGRDLKANEHVAEFVRDKIRTIVEDPRTAATLTPTDYPIGAKRPCVDTDYYATYNLPHVDLVDVRQDPITGFTPRGLATTKRQLDLDTVVLATGYDGMTGPLTRIDIRGRDGVGLAERWQEGPKTYLGLGVADFPNLFTITGPGSPSVLANVIAAIEQHVDWIVDCLARLRDAGIEEIEAQLPAQEAWVDHVNDVAAQTLFVHAKSWYLGSNIEGKKEVFMPYPGGMLAYRAKCDEVAAEGYAGFTLRGGAGAPRTVTTASEGSPR